MVLAVLDVIEDLIAGDGAKAFVVSSQLDPHVISQQGNRRDFGVAFAVIHFRRRRALRRVRLFVFVGICCCQKWNIDSRINEKDCNEKVESTWGKTCLRAVQRNELRE